jgi:hypothetical protein
VESIVAKPADGADGAETVALAKTDETIPGASA